MRKTASLDSGQSHLDLNVVEIHEVAVVSVSPVGSVRATGLGTTANVLEFEMYVYWEFDFRVLCFLASKMCKCFRDLVSHFSVIKSRK